MKTINDTLVEPEENEFAYSLFDNEYGELELAEGVYLITDWDSPMYIIIKDNSPHFDGFPKESIEFEDYTDSPEFLWDLYELLGDLGASDLYGGYEFWSVIYDEGGANRFTRSVIFQ